MLDLLLGFRNHTYTVSKEEEDNRRALSGHQQRETHKQSTKSLPEDYEEDSVEPDNKEFPVQSDAEEEEEEDDEEDDEGENDKSFNKNRAPIRKSSSLIQYWLDTGKAPYSTTEDPSILNELIPSDNSGSSLSEESCPNHNPLPIATNVIPVPEGASNSSSVATGPYIRSTNITNRSEMLVIMEGSKSPEGHLEPADAPGPEGAPETWNLLEADQSRPNTETPANPEVGGNCNKINQAPEKSVETSLILSKLEETVEKSLNRSRLTSCDGSDSEVRNLMAPRIKISDALEGLDEHIDKLVNKSTVHRLRKDFEVGSGDSSGRGTPKFPSLMKKGNRRKLWTGRNSPMDIIVSSTMDSEDQMVPKTKNQHPALQATPKVRVKVPSFKKRKTLNARRHSRVFLNRDPSRNSKDSSDPSTEGREKRFLKNLGLVPSPRFNTKTKRKIISGVAERKGLRRRQKGKVRYQEIDSETDDGSSSGISVKSCTGESDNLLSLCAKKILTVPLERLSETLLGRTVSKRKNRKSSSVRHLENERTSGSISRSGSSPAATEVISAKRMGRGPEIQKIELDSQESDQSTIIMMQCEEKRAKRSVLRERLQKSGSDSEISREATETDASTPDDKGDRRISAVRLRRSKKSNINSKKGQGAAKTAKLISNTRGEKTKPNGLLTRSKKSVIGSKTSHGARNGNVEEKILSVLLVRSKPSVIDSEKVKNSAETEESTPVGEGGKIKAIPPGGRNSKNSSSQSSTRRVSSKTETSPNGKSSSPYATRSRRHLSDSDRSSGVINGNLISEEESMEQKLDNRTIRRMRQRAVLRNKKIEQRKRRSRKVNPKKMKVKHSKDEIELPNGIESSMEDSLAPDGQRSPRGVDEETQKGGTTIIRGTVTIESDSSSDSSRGMKLRKLPSGIRRRCLEPVIKFSDEENDFIMKMEMSYHRAQRRSMRRGIVEEEFSADQQQLIHDLTSEIAPLCPGTILPSDEEENYESSQVKNKKTSDRTARITRSGSQKSERVLERAEKSVVTRKRSSFARVLDYDDASSKQWEEVDESPPKKFKAEIGVINKDSRSGINKSVSKNKSFNMEDSRESDSSGLSRGSVMMLLGKSTRSSGIKRKAECEENRGQEGSSMESKHTPVRKSRSPIKQAPTPVQLPTKKLQTVIKSPAKRLHSPEKKLLELKLMDLSVSVDRISENLEKSLNKDGGKLSGGVPPTNHPRNPVHSVRRSRRKTRKQTLTSEDESSVDFYLEQPTDSQDNLFDKESSDVDSVKCTKLFHNPFEDFGGELRIPMTRNLERSRSSTNTHNNVGKKSVITLRTRDDSDSDD
ncbi:uncharacterized protein LOC135161737 isoform X2 [Diachasmimorpha longicaudata]|uniref:uncharacterized protein LOC135161737 isoform X2 n=1 Tax=Diachasmimorpha longicaudata TaxID=58733 RepID=UPI0030B8EB51